MSGSLVGVADGATSSCAVGVAVAGGSVAVGGTGVDVRVGVACGGDVGVDVGRGGALQRRPSWRAVSQKSPQPTRPLPLMSNIGSWLWCSMARAMIQRSCQLTRPSPLKSAQRRPVPGVLVAVGWPTGVDVRVLVADGSVCDVGVRVGVLVAFGAGVGVFVAVFGTGVLVGGSGVFVGTGVLVDVAVGVFVRVGVDVLVAVRVGVRVGVLVGVFVGVAVGNGPIQIVMLVNACWKLLPVAKSPMTCEPRLSVDELRVNDGPVLRKPFCDDDQTSWPLTSAVPSESWPLPAKVMTVFSGITAPFVGDVMLTVGGPTAAAETGGDEPASIESEATTNAAKAKKQVRTATPIVN
jgi:hypothetical protein